MNSLQVNQIIDTLDNKFLFNIDFPIDLNIISFDEYPLLHKLDEENVHLQANIFNDSNQGSLLKKKRMRKFKALAILVKLIMII